MYPKLKSRNLEGPFGLFFFLVGGRKCLCFKLSGTQHYWHPVYQSISYTMRTSVGDWRQNPLYIFSTHSRDSCGRVVTSFQVVCPIGPWVNSSKFGTNIQSDTRSNCLWWSNVKVTVTSRLSHSPNWRLRPYFTFGWILKSLTLILGRHLEAVVTGENFGIHYCHL